MCLKHHLTLILLWSTVLFTVCELGPEIVFDLALRSVVIIYVWSLRSLLLCV